MGITIHYRGKLDHVGTLVDLCRELADIADLMGWESTTLDEDWSVPPDARLIHGQAGSEIIGNLSLKGIQIQPGSNSESLEFFFDCECNLRSIMNTVMICEGMLEPEDAWNFVKTQFTGPEMHIWIIGLLKYIARHYVSNLEVRDEGEYWETQNRKILEEKMRFINQAIEDISEGLASNRFGSIKGLSAEKIADRIERLLLDRYPDRTQQ